MFASRTNWKLNPNSIALCRQKLEEKGIRILDLSESNPTRCKPPYWDKQLLKAFTSPQNLLYQPAPRGLKKTRQAITHHYRTKGISIDPGNIFLTASTSEAYSFIFRLLLNPGERVLIPKPSYPLFDYLAGLNDVSLDSYSLRYDHQWEIDMESLKKAYHPETKAIILVNPNNPTGSYVKENELRQIITFAKDHQLALISDEVFSSYSFFKDKDRVLSLAESSEVLSFTLGGISKALGLPQMKLAWMIVSGPSSLTLKASERLEVILDTYLSVSTPIQHALPKWFSLGEKIQRRLQKQLNQNLNFLKHSLSQHSPCSLLKPEGGWYAILKIPKIKSEEKWVLEFLERDHIYVQPGYFFDFFEETYIILSLLTPSKTFQTGVHRILSRIEKESAR